MKFEDQYRTQINWLLRGDPSIKYQTLRDLLNSDEQIILKERELISVRGWGKKLLDLQQENGMWGNGIYSPKWISTFYTLLTLKLLGMKNNPKVNKACLLVYNKCFYEDYGINVAATIKSSDVCVTAMFLGILCHFKINDERNKLLVDNLKKNLMADGGWNCSIRNGAVHSSVHTTLSVLEGLFEYEKMYGSSNELNKLRVNGIEFLLNHRLFRSHTTGEIIDNKFLLFSFPPRWYYDVMKALDYFQSINHRKDQRITESIEILNKKQTPEGFWKLQNNHKGRVFFDMEKQGEPSRWNTLRALRILKWWGG